ncbi:MAG: DNA polymerase IV, partial [Candidatus Bathyarchaeia archaeon]
EAFLDVTSKVKNFEEAVKLAQEIKKEIFEKEKLTCSLGIGPNKLVAKIASDFQKPDGLTAVKEEEAESFLAPLPVRKLLWVGRKTEQKLAQMGIKTVGDLAKYDPSVLIEAFGAVGTQLYMMARGIDNSEVEERSEAKSVSRESTFEEDTLDYELVFRTLDEISKQVHDDVLKQEYTFKTVTIKVRYENFETHTYAKTLPYKTNRLQDLQKTARELFKASLKRGRKIRLVGVRVSTLESTKKQKTLL